jgi:S-phase kinase-associated protein 1
LLYTVNEDHEDEESPDVPIEIPITNVSTAILKQIVEFCEHHVTEPMVKIDQPLKSHVMSDVVQDYYAEFVNVEQETLRDLIMAANFMNINPLLNLTCAKVATFTAGMTPSEIRSTFDMTSEDIIAPALAVEQPAAAEAENPVAEPQQEQPPVVDENPAES